MYLREKKLLTEITDLATRNKKLSDFIQKIAQRVKEKYHLKEIWIYLSDFKQTPKSSFKKISKENIVNLIATTSSTQKTTLFKKTVKIKWKDDKIYSFENLSPKKNHNHKLNFFLKQENSYEENFLLFELPFFESETGVFIYQKYSNFTKKETQLLKRISHSILYEIESIHSIALDSLSKEFKENKKPSTQKEFPIQVFSDQSFYGEVITIFKEFNLDTYLNSKYEKHQNSKKIFTLADFLQAHRVTLTQIDRLQMMIEKENNETSYMVFSGHLLILQDKEYQGRIEKKIKNGTNPSQAIVEVTQAYIDLFSKSDLRSIREKILDIKDIGYRLIQNLFTENDKAESLKDKVVLTNEIFPSEFLQFFYQGVKGVIVIGNNPFANSITHHTKIIARSLEIGIAYFNDKEKLFSDHKQMPHRVLVRTNKKKLYLNPNKKSIHLNKFKQKINRKTYRNIHTKDGTEIAIYGNINLLIETEQINQLHLRGVGLFRSEMFYMIHNYFPSEEVQYNYYSALASRLKGKTLTVRTLDLGDDKTLPYFPEITKENSILGLRGIRFSLQHQKIFKTQIKALLRTADQIPLKISIPFIYSVEEIVEVKKIFKECLKELKYTKKVNHPQYQLGIMIELPSTLLILEELADEVDFFSIGTNDLSRYLLAVDESNHQVRSLLTYSHPAVFRALKWIMNISSRKKIETTQCGVMGSDNKYTEFLLGIGIRNFSIPPAVIPEFAKTIHKISIPTAQKKAENLLKLKNIKDIKKALVS